MITYEQLCWLSNIIRTIYAARTYGEFSERVTQSLHKRFYSLVTLCERLSLDYTQYGLDHVVADIPMLPGYEPYVWDNPNFVRLVGGDASLVLRLSEVGQSLKCTEFYNEICRPHGIKEQLAILTREGGGITWFSINRDTICSANDRLLFELLQPHIAAGLRRVRNNKSWEMPTFGQRWIELSADMHPLSLLVCQRAVLRIYFPGWTPGVRLPEEMRRWVATSQRMLKSGPIRPLQLFSVASARGTMCCRFFPNVDRPGGAILLREHPADPNFFEIGRQRGLSTRQSEILHHLAEGKRDSEIATILGLAPKTVSKHVEHIFKKFGVTNRTAAVTFAQTVER